MSNSAPTTTPVTLTAMPEDGGPRLITQAELLANASDVDGQALTASNLAIAAGNGTLVDNPDGTWSYTPAANDDSAVSFSYSVSDGSLSTDGAASLDLVPGAISWIGGSTGDWDDPANWSGGQVPTADDGVVVDLTGITITHNANKAGAAEALTLGPNDNLELTAGSLTVESASAIGGALKISGGMLSLGGATQAASFQQDGGILTGDGTLTVTGNAALGMVDGDEFGETGGMTLELAGTTTFGTASDNAAFEINAGAILKNTGTFTWTNGTFELGYDPQSGVVGDATIVNAAGAVFDIAHNGGVIDNFLSGNSFENDGTVTTDGLSGSATIGVEFNNTGVVDVSSGTLILNHGGNSNGTFNVTAGAMLEFDGGDFNLTDGISLTGQGTIEIAGGTLTTSGAFDVGALIVADGSLALTDNAETVNFDQEGGGLTGTGNLTVTGTALFGATHGGSLAQAGNGTTVLLGTTTLGGDTTTPSLDIGNNRTLQNSGSFTWNSGEIYLGYSSGPNIGYGIIHNTVGGIFNIATAGTIHDYGGNPGNAFNNDGIVTTNGLAGVATIEVAFNNSGAVNVTSGTLLFTHDGNSTGTYNISLGGVLEFALGKSGLSGSVSGAGKLLVADAVISATSDINVGEFELDGGTLGVVGALNVSGPATIDRGSLTVESASAIGGALKISGGMLSLGGATQAASFQQDGGILTGGGTLTVTGNAALGTVGGGEFGETGGMTLELAGTTTFGTASGGAVFDINAGAILKNAGALTWTNGTFELGYDTQSGFVGGATIFNAAGAVFDIAHNGGVIDNFSGGNSFENDGTVTTDGLSGSATIGVQFNNTGVVDVSSGTLILNHGGNSTGTFNVTTGATLEFDGNYTMSGGTASGLGTVLINNGTLEFTQTIDAITTPILHIGSTANSILKFDGGVGDSAVHPAIVFDGGVSGKGVLELSSTDLANFHGIVSGFNEGEGIKISGAASASLASNTELAVYDSASNVLGTIELGNSYAGSTFGVTGGVITVNVNDAPISAPVTLTALPEDGGPRLITQAELLANASDVDGPALTASNLAIAAGNGTLVDKLDGTWSYTPAADDDSAVSFSYTVSDGSLSTAGAASLDLTPVNDAPISAPVTLTAMPEDGGPRLITQTELLANASDVDGPALTASNLAIAAGNGTLVDNPDGTWSYTPAADDDSAVSFSYTVSDGSLSTAGAASLDLTPVNDAPISAPVTLTALPEDGGPRLITQTELLANASDIDGPALTASNLAIAAGNGTLVDKPDGTWSYTPAADDDSAVSFSYTVSDGSLSTAGAASLDLTPVNDAPISAPVTLTALPEDGGPRLITQTELLANASDVDGPALTATNLAIAAGNGTLVDNPDGTWSYTPAADDDSAVSFSYTVSDGSLSTAGSASLDLTPVNDAPISAPVTLTALPEDGGPRLITQTELLANASDVDGPALTASNLAIAAGNGTLVDNPDGTWSYTPAADDDSAVSFSYTVSDGSLSTAGAASLDLTPVNDAPISAPVTLTAMPEDGGPRLITQTELLANASDVDGPALTASNLAIAAGNGTLVDNPDGTWSYTPAADDDSAVSFSYTVSDGSLSTAGAASLDLTPVNDAPTAPVRNDFNGDGKSDIAWQNSSSNAVYLWEMNGTTQIGGGVAGTGGDGWNVAGIGDFNGDGKSDIAWQNSSSNAVYLWEMNGTTQIGGGVAGTGGDGWNVAGIGDFNGDGKSDIAWQNSSSNAVYLWEMNGTTQIGGGVAGTGGDGWNIAGIGDFNGDGKSDIAWQNSSSNAVYLWEMNGTTQIGGGVAGTGGDGWNVAGIGDFNGDGKSDIAWQNSSSNAVYLWEMNGTTQIGGGVAGTGGDGWNVAGIGDFNGDGKSDIAWQNSSSNAVYLWEMNGTTQIGGGPAGIGGDGWNIIDTSTGGAAQQLASYQTTNAGFDFNDISGPASIGDGAVVPVAGDIPPLQSDSASLFMPPMDFAALGTDPTRPPGSLFG